ncbi:MAG: hypothetical protein KGY38_07385 [Desulfobacterales bacterium]|nr:hypothetical protein [Desulfobacterales bacterium]MBS3809956.1 hypothetical protein [Desulfobacterales bacterium]
MNRGCIRQIMDVKWVWKEEVVVDGRIETVRSVEFVDGLVIQDRERFPYLDFNMNDSVPESPLGYRIWWHGCQRCEAWRQVIQDLLIEKGDMTAFKFAMQVLILYEDRWMDFFVCEDCMKLRRKGIRRNPKSKMFTDWGPEGAYPPPIHRDWRRIATDMNRFGEGGLASL